MVENAALREEEAVEETSACEFHVPTANSEEKGISGGPGLRGTAGPGACKGAGAPQTATAGEGYQEIPAASRMSLRSSAVRYSES